MFNQVSGYRALLTHKINYHKTFRLIQVSLEFTNSAISVFYSLKMSIAESPQMLILPKKSFRLN